MIAKKELGNQDRWIEIARLNNIEGPYQLLVGQTIKLPDKISMFIPQPPAISIKHPPATTALARGLLFVVFEQLPDVGSNKVIRKVAVIPKNYALAPKNPSATFSAAEHAYMGHNLETQFLSTSNRPYGAPKFQGEPLLIDLNMVGASGSRVYTEQELIMELRRYSAQTGANVDMLIQTIQKAEGEVLIEGSVSGDAVKRVSNAHTPYIKTAEEIWSRFEAKEITRPQMETELESLAKAYGRAKIVGRVGRVLTVVGVVLTAVDLGVAGKKSYDKSSFRPLAAETVRQIGGWSGAYAGGVTGAAFGAAITSETGPGAIIGGALFAMVFGAIGYWRGDVIAGWIDPPEQVKMELRKDVNFAEGLKYRDIPLTVETGEDQYNFRRRALIVAAMEVQRETYMMVDRQLPTRFANQLAPLRASNITRDYQLDWIKNADGTNPVADANSDGIIESEEWQKQETRLFTYRLGDNEVDELIKMIFGLPR